MILSHRRDDVPPPLLLRSARRCVIASAAALLASCGGGGTNPIGNPQDVSNPSVTSGQHLAFAYFEKCVEPILFSQISNGSSTNSCAGAGCHAAATGTGGAFRLELDATAVDVTDPANTSDVIRATDIYKNFYSAQGEVVIGDPIQSKLFQKPLVLTVNHGGGKIFTSDTDPNATIFKYWITHPAPDGQDEFSPATYSMFTPPDPNTGTCNSQ